MNQIGLLLTSSVMLLMGVDSNREDRMRSLKAEVGMGSHVQTHITCKVIPYFL